MKTTSPPSPAADSSKPETARGTSPVVVKLEIRGQSIPNFKNAKRWLTKLPNGKPLARPFLITDHKVRKIMDEIIRSFESQLLSTFPQIADATLTEPSRRSLIASLLPFDDCWNQMPEVIIKAQLCESPADEGVTVTIERL